MKVFVAPPSLIGQPDVAAMLQAFYSRSHKSIDDRLMELSDNTGSVDKIRQSLKSFYIGYGHESIGDCGNILLFIEGVSMLTAKAIQDNPLYNGQETSSRYIDFVQQPRPDYADSNYDLCISEYDRVRHNLTHKYINEGLTDKAAAVRAFDVARGILPIGVPTQLSWYGSIRSIRQQISDLGSHPSGLVRFQVSRILDTLVDYMPDMFEKLPVPRHRDFFIGNRFDSGLLELQTTEIPKSWQDLNDSPMDLSDEEMELIYGTARLVGDLDYGSYRDIQRHRRATIKCSVPDPTEWNVQYLERINDADLLAGYRHKDPLECSFDDCVLGAPLMSMCKVYTRMSLPQLIYMLKLRTSPHVHFSARNFMYQLADQVMDSVPVGDWFTGLINRTPTDYARRAKQDISKV